jgi:pilus assembly protein FimV
LKAGVVLSVPSAETAAAVDAGEARQMIRAQSADFGSFRQRLASAVPAVRADASVRKDSGKLQAKVEDRKVAAATPDKLTLSKGASAATGAASEVKISKEKEKQAAAARMAELSKNVEQLKKLSGAASAGKGTTVGSLPLIPPAAAPSTAAVKAVPPAATVVAAAPVLPNVPSVPPVAAVASAAASAVVTAPVVAAPVAAASALIPETKPVVADAPVVASAPAVVAAASAVAPAPKRVEPPVVAADTTSEPGFLGDLLGTNPWFLALGGGALLALLGFGVYRARKPKLDSGETSFLESRLQPDSFFGASGGQRIDTREATNSSPSSMSYSLSQLDAIGDVDPVAEADVYLAYGRDLQAEEILKEAMRSNPDRLAIRTKLLEVYAKRRDTKGFELLATQLYSLTGGNGEDWNKAQELGRDIDPDNSLYQAGGLPASMVAGDSGLPAEPLGASTMPQSVLPTQSRFARSQDENLGHTPAEDIDFDLDLDPSRPVPLVTQPGALESFDFKPAAVTAAAGAAMGAAAASFMPSAAKAAVADSGPASSLEFDLSGISLDLDKPATAAHSAADSKAPHLRIDDDIDHDNADPLVRKLELAEEFRQIGDSEGARDLLQEVASKADGALKSKALGMLAELG